MKKKMTLSLAFACILFVTVLAVSAFAASNLLGGRPDGTLSPLSPGATVEPTPMPTLIPMPTPMPTVMPTEGPADYWCTENGTFYHADENCSGMKNALPVSAQDAQAMGKAPCPVCVEQSNDAQADGTRPNISAADLAGCTPMPGDPQPYDLDEAMVFLSEIGLAYHFDADCGFASSKRVPLRDLLARGYRACPYCVPSYDGASELDDGLSLMIDFTQPLRTGEPRGWGIELTDPNRDDFNAGSEPLNSEPNGSWTNDILTVHNAIFLKTRSAVYCEFEFSVNDAAISPWSIRITPHMGQGPLGWHDAHVHEVSGEDNTIHYLLSVTMDSPADAIDNIWYVYGGNAADEHRLVGILGDVD